MEMCSIPGDNIQIFFFFCLKIFSLGNICLWLYFSINAYTTDHFLVKNIEGYVLCWCQEICCDEYEKGPS